MKRILLVATMALVMAAMMVAMAMPAFAVASSKANCLGQGESEAATSDGRALGQGTAAGAQQYQGIGQELSPGVSSSPCNPGK